jgi:solute carrier family 34 (sodium-dependent phosphate cotransporter)
MQSSSVTTSIIVGLTASGALTIGNAIPMVMGANIGTSITNTLVSLGHITKKSEFRNAFEVATVHDFFNFFTVIILFPLEVYFHILEKSAVYLTTFILGSNLNLSFTSPLDYAVKPAANFATALLGSNAILMLILSMTVLFMSLRYFVKVMKPIAQSEFKHLLNKHIFSKPARAFSFGALLTILVQSSSVTTSFIVPMAGVGIFNIETIFPYVLGANIGTTFTALMASIVTGSGAAVTVALAHLLFNVFGCILVIPIRILPISLSKYLANISMRSRLIPFVYIVSVFYIIPVLVILLFS